MRVLDFMKERASEWLRASGATDIMPHYPSQPGLSGGQHQAGTCRMGHDPQTSVTDAWGRVHGHDNLFVADGSLHVTNGGFNPVLTILSSPTVSPTASSVPGSSLCSALRLPPLLLPNYWGLGGLHPPPPSPKLFLSFCRRCLTTCGCSCILLCSTVGVQE